MTIGCQEHKTSSLKPAEALFIFQADVPDIVKLLSQQGEVLTSKSLTDGQTRVKAPFSFLTVRKRDCVGFSGTIHETEVPLMLVGFMLQDGGKKLKTIHTQTGVTCVVRYRTRQVSDEETMQMQIIRFYFGSLPFSERDNAANAAVHVLRKMFVELYDEFATHPTTYVYPPCINC